MKGPGIALILSANVLASGCVQQAPPPAAQAPSQAPTHEPPKSTDQAYPRFGLIDDIIEPGPRSIYSRTGLDIATDARSRGFEIWRLFIWWDAYEPRPNQFDQGYVKEIKRDMDHLLQLGYKVEIAITIGELPPDWIQSIPGSKYKNQFGKEFDEGFSGWRDSPYPSVNLIFNPEIRREVAEAITQLFKDFSEYRDRIHAVVMMTGGGGDAIYPWLYEDPTNSWWAFDVNAQNVNEPGSLAGPNPLLGWRPGIDESDPEKAAKFYWWYVNSAVRAVEWHIMEFRKHFKGTIKVAQDIPWNHVNVTEADIERAIATGLDGSAPEGFWRLLSGYSSRYAEVLSKHPNIVPHHTAVEFVTDEEVRFMMRYFNRLSGENAQFIHLEGEDVDPAKFKGREVLDQSLERILRHGIDELEWMNGDELYKFENPSPDYFEVKIRTIRRSKR